MNTCFWKYRKLFKRKYQWLQPYKKVYLDICARWLSCIYGHPFYKSTTRRRILRSILPLHKHENNLQDQVMTILTFRIDVTIRVNLTGHFSGVSPFNSLINNSADVLAYVASLLTICKQHRISDIPFRESPFWSLILPWNLET